MRNGLRFGFFGAVALLIFGCEKPNNQLVIVGNQNPVGNAAAPVVVVPTNVTYQVGAVSGRRQQVDFKAAINPDCTTVGETLFSLSQPLHGSADVQPGLQFASFSPPNPRVHCNDRRVQGTAVFYTSAPDYRGPDQFIASGVTATGQRFIVTYILTVQ